MKPPGKPPPMSGQSSPQQRDEAFNQSHSSDGSGTSTHSATPTMHARVAAALRPVIESELQARGERSGAAADQAAFDQSHSSGGHGGSQAALQARSERSAAAADQAAFDQSHSSGGGSQEALLARVADALRPVIESELQARSERNAAAADQAAFDQSHSSGGHGE
jgi:hypothetical protein